MQAIILNKIGDPSVLKIKEVEEPKPQKDEILIRHTAIGVNFFDVSFRRGQYKLLEMPAILGSEACGVIEALGAGVTEFKVGERVAYATGPLGAYCEKRAVHKRYVLAVPQNIGDTIVAGSLFKGLMAHTLLFRVFLAKRAKKILVHSATGGVGQFLCQWARSLNIEVIGTVGSDAKINRAQANGCNHVINYKSKNFVEELAKITEGGGVGAVYDGVGKDTLIKSMECLWPTGICISYGETSGSTGPFDANLLVANSLFFTRPSLALYKSNRIELALGAAEVFNLLGKGVLRPHIATYPFQDVAKAHAALESRESSGSLVLTL
jgi:NADPH:quinone reductase